MSYLALGCRAALALVFGVAVVAKLRDYRGFVAALAAMRLLPANWSGVVAPVAVAAEAAVAVLLGSGWRPVLAFGVAAALLALLTGAVTIVVARGTAASCRCFGRVERPLAVRHVVRNILLATLAGTGAAATLGGAGAGVPPAGAVVALLSAGVAALLVTTADDLVELFTPGR
ncbi:MauE/DoxX family redox-associated membrane protein [Micromonospora sp. NPDC049559]|uniref:MauE/DoxX family redox-associated membrane protein n=1 Tax=Micromonospora sp. NPDC049559 TaxID=3155923 RepID=UPI0034363F90